MISALENYITALRGKLKNSLLHEGEQKVSISFGGLKFSDFPIIAGPCSIRDEFSTLQMAKDLTSFGIKFFRAGCYKPRTSPFSFQGLGEEGLKILSKVKTKYNLITMTEILDFEQIELYSDVDILQVGARNMQNFSLLKKLSTCDKPIILKRGFGASLDEWLLASEYLALNGKENIILCERGEVSPFSVSCSLDVVGVQILNRICKFPVVLDPSHLTKHHSFVSNLAISARPLGYDGIMLEYIDDRAKALTDGFQSVDRGELETIVKSLKIPSN